MIKVSLRILLFIVLCNSHVAGIKLAEREIEKGGFKKSVVINPYSTDNPFKKNTFFA